MRRYLSVIIILAGISLKTYAQDAGAPLPLSLEDCMNYALKHNYTVKNAQLDVLIQIAQNNEVISAAYPHLSAKGEFDDYVVPQRTLFPTGSFGALFQQLGLTLPPSAADQPEYSAIQISPQYSLSGSLSASQTLFDGGVLVALQARNTVVKLAQLTGEVTNENIRYNVLKAYNALVIAYRQYGIVKNSLNYARSIQHDIKVTQENGFAEKIEVERTDVQVNNLATDSLRIGNLLTVSEQLLKYQMGMDINTPIVLIDTNLEERKTEALALLETEKDYEKIPEYNLYNTQLIANQYNLKRYKLEALPSLNIFANGGYNFASEHVSDLGYGPNYLSSLLVGLQLNIPIFNGFMRVNQVKEAKLNVEKSKNNIDNVKLTIDFQAAQSRTSLRNAMLEAASQNRNLDLANDVLDLARKKYKAGVGSSLEVNQAQTDQLTAQNNYFSSLLDIINAEADLKKALGLLK